MALGLVHGRQPVVTRHKNGAKQSRPLGRIIESRQDRLLFEQVSFLGFCGSPSLDRKPWAKGPTTNDPCRGAFLFGSEPAASLDTVQLRPGLPQSGECLCVHIGEEIEPPKARDARSSQIKLGSMGSTRPFSSSGFCMPPTILMRS